MLDLQTKTLISQNNQKGTTMLSRLRFAVPVTRLLSSKLALNHNSFKFNIGNIKYFSRNTRDTSAFNLSAEQDEYTNEPVYSDDKDGYAVHSSDVVNPKIVRVPYLTPSMKADIYNLYITEVNNKKDSANINNNTIIRSIAKKYNASFDRIQAVIFLAENKIKFMKDNKVDVISDEHNTIYRKIKELSDAIELEKQKEAESKTTKSNKDKKVVAVAAVDAPPAAGGDGATTPVAVPEKLLTVPELQAELSKEYNISVEEIKVIYDRLLKHHIWLDNEAAFNEYYEELMNMYTASGVDIAFRETSFDTKSKKNENYYPSLFDDEDEEEAKRKLIKRVRDETRAVPDTDIFTYINKDPVKDSANAVPTGNSNINNAERTKINRWKFAFKDLSQGKDARTVMYTRNGKLRYANPLEESKRSWVTNQPSLVDLTLNKSSIEKYQDYDNDQVKVQEFIKSKSIRNNLILNEKNTKSAKK
jgi:hypothetical protein